MSEINPEVLKAFGYWGSILVLKMLAMTLLTARQRMRKNALASPEDMFFRSKGKPVHNDPDVERVRRAHLNDLENVLPWFIITYFWLGTGPSPWLAKILIQTFVLARIGHTVSYVILQNHPLRGLTFGVASVITVYETFKTLLYYY